MARAFDDTTRRNIAELCAAFVREPIREPMPMLKRAAVVHLVPGRPATPLE